MLKNFYDNITHVVIIGAGFGGLAVANNLKDIKSVMITIIDKNNYHVFQPFLHQVACADLAPSDIAIPIREQFKEYKNITVIMDTVVAINTHDKSILTEKKMVLLYDYLIIATGSEDNYYENNEWKHYTIGLKSLRDALKIRYKLLEAFEGAEIDPDRALRSRLMSAVIIGGGPTGIELAGSIAELVRYSLKSDFVHIDPLNTKIFLIESASRLLPSFDVSLSSFTHQSLSNKGISILVNTKVEQIKEGIVLLSSKKKIYSNLIIWAAGVKASPIKEILGIKPEFGINGKIKVKGDLSLLGDDNIFAVGDVCEVKLKDGSVAPSLAAVATQQGKFVANLIKNKLCKNTEKIEFNYKDLGTMVIIGKCSAISQFKRFKIKGMLSWIVWKLVHIYFLIGIKNRLIVFIKWAWSYGAKHRGERLIIR